MEVGGIGHKNLVARRWVELLQFYLEDIVEFSLFATTALCGNQALALSFPSLHMSFGSSMHLCCAIAVSFGIFFVCNSFFVVIIIGWCSIIFKVWLRLFSKVGFFAKYTRYGSIG